MTARWMDSENRGDAEVNAIRATPRNINQTAVPTEVA